MADRKDVCGHERRRRRVSRRSRFTQPSYSFVSGGRDGIDRSHRSVSMMRMRVVSPLLFPPGIRLSTRHVSGLPYCDGLAPVRFRRSIRSAPSTLCGLTPFPCGSVRTRHRSKAVVSFLFQRQRSPAPGLRPVTCPDGGGTFLIDAPSTEAPPSAPTGTGHSLPLYTSPRARLSRSVVEATSNISKRYVSLPNPTRAASSAARSAAASRSNVATISPSRTSGSRSA